jgi:lipopolysaccharide export system permease protein
MVRTWRAPLAHYASPGWRLTNASTFDVAAVQSSIVTSATIAKGIQPTQLFVRRVDPEAQPLSELSGSIAALKGEGRRTAELEGKWWHKISGPLAAVLMPLLGAVAGFGLARSGQMFARAVIGMSLGFAYFVVENTALAMGGFGGYPPLLAAWGPFVLFALLGETVLIRTEE